MSESLSTTQRTDLLDAQGRFTGRYWWHERIIRELRYLSDHGMAPTLPIDALADNVGDTRSDCARYCEQLIAWGELVETDERLWDYPGRWVTLAS